MEINGKKYETMKQAAKSRGIRYETLKSWIYRHNVPLFRFDDLRDVFILADDADKYKAVGAGRPPKPKPGDVAARGETIPRDEREG